MQNYLAYTNLMENLNLTIDIKTPQHEKDR